MSRRQAATGLAAGLSLMSRRPSSGGSPNRNPPARGHHGERRGRRRVGLHRFAGSVAGTRSHDRAQHSREKPSTDKLGTEDQRAPKTTAPKTTAPRSTAPKSSAPESSAKPKPTAATRKKAAPKAAPAPAPPVRIELPTLGVDAPVIPAGVDEEGVMEIPKDVGEVGWYRFGPAPGAAAGSCGADRPCRRLPAGRRRFRPARRSESRRCRPGVGRGQASPGSSRCYLEGGMAPRTRFPSTGSSIGVANSRLVFITCGGSFNESTLGYDDNIAITAVPIRG